MTTITHHHNDQLVSQRTLDRVTAAQERTRILIEMDLLTNDDARREVRRRAADCSPCSHPDPALGNG